MSGELPSPVDETTIVAAMTALLGRRVQTVVPLIGSVGGQNVRIQTSDGVFAMKIGPHDLVANELWACAWAAAHRVLAPEVAEFDLTGGLVGRPFALLRWQHGKDAKPGDEAVADAGRQIARLHATSISGYGPVVVSADGAGARGDFASWDEHLDSIEDRQQQLTAARILDVDVSRAATRALAAVRPDLRLDRPGSVLHGDLHLRHFLTTAGRLTGILDWADACVGDPLADLAVLSRDGHDVLAAFAIGYGLDLTPSVLRKVVGYRLLSTIDTLWFEWHTGGDWFDAYRARIDADARALPSMS